MATLPSRLQWELPLALCSHLNLGKALRAKGIFRRNLSINGGSQPWGEEKIHRIGKEKS